MASFQSFLHVGGKKYEILHSDLFLGQAVDESGRPASPTFGGIFTVKLYMFGSDDPTLAEWMLSPTKIMDGKVVLKRIDSNATLKVIKFYNAFCVGMDIHFDGAANASFFTVTLRISPEQIDIGGLFHDNKWPDESPIHEIADADESRESGLLSDIAHGVLDVAGMVPVIGELADGANALFYLAEGNKTDAALSAAAMIPIAGWAATGAKAVRKGVKIAEKARAVKKVTDKVNRAAKTAAKRLDSVVKAANNLPSAAELARGWQGSGNYPGVDKWRDIILPKGKVIYAGEPGASGFFITESALNKSSKIKEKLWQGLQVAPHEKFGYRTKVGIFEAIEDTPAAFGKALANEQHGIGGLQQIFAPNMEKFKKIGEITLN